MSKLYVAMARNGDLLCQLPMFYSEFQKTGEKVKVMVTKEFSPLLDGCSYVEKVIFDGEYKELGRAVTLARGMSEDVVVTSLHGSSDDVEKFAYAQIGQKHATAENFQKEAWKLAGREADWDECLPLVFDQRDKEREEFLLRANGFKAKGKRKPVILLAIDGGVTAPFPYRDLLRKLVTLEFGDKYRILELPMVEPDGRIYDLLALYEQAALLIAIDSMPLHLAWACPKLPVFALANDKPSNWYGAAWRPNHLWFCRYSDFPARAAEMLEMINIQSLNLSGNNHIVVSYSQIPIPFTVKSDGKWLPIVKGMCRDAEGFPLLRDVIRIALQASSDTVSLFRNGIEYKIKDRSQTFYAYRIHKGQFHPIVDLFSAPKAFWKKILPEIPDLILDNNDTAWSQALMVIFRKHGAQDCTGCCQFVGGEK